MSELICLTAPLLSGVAHGFLGRTGGASSGLFASLNVGLGSSDDQARVRENRARVVARVAPGAQLVTVHQVHSSTCVDAAHWPDAARPHADAIVTNQPGLLLGVLTADCAPILFADPEAGVVGAAHAGWKGALTGVVSATVGKMAALGADPARMRAVVGPCIAQRSYEVDAGFRERVLADDPGHAGFFEVGARANHFQFDLEGFVARRLDQAGVGHIATLGEDTYSQPERFFSYRRTTHASEPDYGRQISVIALA
jgi:polyphenol oxidase